MRCFWLASKNTSRVTSQEFAWHYLERRTIWYLFNIIPTCQFKKTAWKVSDKNVNSPNVRLRICINNIFWRNSQNTSKLTLRLLDCFGGKIPVLGLSYLARVWSINAHVIYMLFDLIVIDNSRIFFFNITLFCFNHELMLFVTCLNVSYAGKHQTVENIANTIDRLQIRLLMLE